MPRPRRRAATRTDRGQSPSRPARIAALLCRASQREHQRAVREKRIEPLLRRQLSDALGEIRPSRVGELRFHDSDYNAAAAAWLAAPERETSNTGGDPTLPSATGSGGRRLAHVLLTPRARSHTPAPARRRTRAPARAAAPDPARRMRGSGASSRSTSVRCTSTAGAAGRARRSARQSAGASAIWLHAHHRGSTLEARLMPPSDPGLP